MANLISFERESKPQPFVEFVRVCKQVLCFELAKRPSRKHKTVKLQVKLFVNKQEKERKKREKKERNV